MRRAYLPQLHVDEEWDGGDDDEGELSREEAEDWDQDRELPGRESRGRTGSSAGGCAGYAREWKAWVLVGLRMGMRKARRRWAFGGGACARLGAAGPLEVGHAQG